MTLETFDAMMYLTNSLRSEAGRIDELASVADHAKDIAAAAFARANELTMTKVQPFWRKPPVRLPSGEWSEPWPEGEFLCAICTLGRWVYRVTKPLVNSPSFAYREFAEWIADIPKTPE